MANIGENGKGVYVTMLGKFSIKSEEATLLFEENQGSKLLKVLCYMIINKDIPISSSKLIDMFWLDDKSSNPESSVKTTMYRIRGMLKPLFKDETKCIITFQGGYRWNPDVMCEIDADEFENLYYKSKHPFIEQKEKMSVYEKAVALYKGSYLSDFSDQIWVTSLNVHYHNIFTDLIHDYCQLLYENEMYDRVVPLCGENSESDTVLNEKLQTVLTRSMLKLGKKSFAMDRYRTAVDMIYKNLGVKVSSEFQNLYWEIVGYGRTEEYTIDDVERELAERSIYSGACLCDFSFFHSMYNLERAKAVRQGVNSTLCLITVTSSRDLNLNYFNSAVNKLSSLLVRNLRASDIITRHGNNQMLVLLQYISVENSKRAMNRVMNLFKEENPYLCVELAFECEPICPDINSGGVMDNAQHH